MFLLQQMSRSSLFLSSSEGSDTLLFPMADSTLADDYLHTLKNLPKLPGPEHSGDSRATRNWCSSETHWMMERTKMMLLSMSVLNLLLSPCPSSRMFSFSRTPHLLTLRLKGRRPWSASLTVASNADPASLLSIGPASNTRSMWNQTDASFLAAGGEPSSSAAPPKKKRKTKEANVVPLDASGSVPNTFQFSSTPASGSTIPTSSQGKSSSLELHSKINSLETQLQALQDHTQSLTTTVSTLRPPGEHQDIRVDIANLQKHVSDMSTIVTGRFLEQHTAITGLTASAGSVPSLTNTLNWSVGRVSDLEAQFATIAQNGPSAENYRETPVASFRSYLNVPIPAHRKALVWLLTSSHILAVEVLRWPERRRPSVPRSQRLCRFCLSEVEDEALALWYCNGSQSLDDLRSDFFTLVFLMATSHFSDLLKSAASSFEVIDVLLGADDMKVVGALAKYVFNVFRIFSTVPLYYSSMSFFSGTPRRVFTPRDTLKSVITTVWAFVATAHGSPCQGCGPGRSLLGPCAGNNTNTNTTYYPPSFCPLWTAKHERNYICTTVTAFEQGLFHRPCLSNT